MRAKMRLLSFVPILVLVAGCTNQPTQPPEGRIPTRSKIAGALSLNLRQRVADKAGNVTVTQNGADWNVAETAIIIIDMWDDIYCKCSSQRIGVMVPRMNAVLTAARDHGVQIIHAPGGTVDMYEDTSYRKRVKQVKPVKPPFDVSSWCKRDEKREPELPLDVSKSFCDDPIPGAMVRKFTREHPGLDISGYDGVSDSGPEIYSFLKSEGIKNVAVMGVHTNICILDRPIGIRRLVKLGFNVVLVRDLTDAMYDPREKPFVSHTRGTELAVEHIERYWCPSILSDDLTRVISGSNGPK
jgi:nicotinamidase-related amidase